MTDVSQLLGRGQKLELFDGEVTILFSAWALAVIEDSYGLESIDALFDDGSKGKMILIGNLLATGIVDREMTGEQLLKLLPLESLNLAINVLQTGLEAAFPKGNREQRRTAEREKSNRQESPGADSSTSGAPSSTNNEPSSGD